MVQHSVLPPSLVPEMVSREKTAYPTQKEFLVSPANQFSESVDHPEQRSRFDMGEGVDQRGCSDISPLQVTKNGVLNHIGWMGPPHKLSVGVWHIRRDAGQRNRLSVRNTTSLDASLLHSRCVGVSIPTLGQLKVRRKEDKPKRPKILKPKRQRIGLFVLLFVLWWRLQPAEHMMSEWMDGSGAITWKRSRLRHWFVLLWHLWCHLTTLELPMDKVWCCLAQYWSEWQYEENKYQKSLLRMLNH